MDETVREHLRKLEQRLQALSQQIMENRRTRDERNKLEAEIRAVNLAITHYRTALELEEGLQTGTR